MVYVGCRFDPTLGSFLYNEWRTAVFFIICMRRLQSFSVNILRNGTGHDSKRQLSYYIPEKYQQHFIFGKRQPNKNI